ncbi:MAG TPA: urate oxidase [Spirochaetia bacterium]|nr:urate oxidase [Spirochaetia bacterium]
MSGAPVALADLNCARRDEFLAVCGPLFEHSPWIAERTWVLKPFASLAALHGQLVTTVESASDQEKIDVIRAHPDLVGKLAETGSLSAESAREQAAAGLDSVTAEEAALFAAYNKEYRDKFGFPFVICARENKKKAILQAFPQRLAQSRDQEIRTALGEIAKIAWLRLRDAVTEASMIRLVENSYGKSDVRMTKVVRSGDTHTLHELTVHIMLGGAFERVYTDGDNAPCIPTDTMKNTVYALAKKNDFDSPEAFAAILARHFLQFAQVGWAEVAIEQEPWVRIPVDGSPHPHSFTRGGSGIRTAQVRLDRGSAPQVSGGVKGLEVIKTTRSRFQGFYKDPYTTLPETSDRIFATRIDAVWKYASNVDRFSDVFERVRCMMLESFAQHDSESVQQTIFAIGEVLLSNVPEIISVSITMPNQHRLLVNLAPFGMENHNEIFVATSEPFGLIKGTVARDGKWEG